MQLHICLCLNKVARRNGKITESQSKSLSAGDLKSWLTSLRLT